MQKIISADSHMCEPPTLWVDRIDRRFRDHAPRIVKDPDGKKGSFFVCENLPHQASTFPNSREFVEKTFVGVPEADKRKIICENAAQLYGCAI